MLTRSLACGLVLLALVCTASGHEYGELSEGSLVHPLAEGDLGEGASVQQDPDGGEQQQTADNDSQKQDASSKESSGEQSPKEQSSEEQSSEEKSSEEQPSEEQPSEESSGNQDGPIDELKKNVDAATDENQVKSSMESTIQKAMADKKEDLLQKASKRADEETEKAAEERAAMEKKEELQKKQAIIDEASAKAESAKAELDKAKQTTKSEEAVLARVDKEKQLLFKRSAAEEEAKTAAANRIAAEERAKISAAERVASEEDAKKAAAMKLTQEEQAQAAQKTPMELHALEAKAFQEAAALKVKEGEALAKVAALKSGNDLKVTQDGDVAKEANAASSLHEAKVELHHLVQQATAALFQAKAKPFDKDALQQVLKMKGLVSQAKSKVMKLAGIVEEDKAAVKTDEKALSRDFDRRNMDVTRSPHDVDAKEEKRVTDMEHPDVDHMTDAQIKYWANKKMKWRQEDPLNKNKVMAKIFQIKNMEAQTLTRMNEVTGQIGMDPDGVRAGMLAKGQNVIIDGVLVKPNPTFHINHVFQGQKGRDPKTEEQGRDPSRDNMKQMSMNEVDDEVKRIHNEAVDEVAAARAAQQEPSAPAGAGDGPPAQTLDDLKKAVLKNKEKGLVPAPEDEDDEAAEKKVEQSPKEEEPAKDSNELGDDDSTADSDDGLEAMAEKEDEDALSDDNDVAVAMDENSMMDDSEPERN